MGLVGTAYLRPRKGVFSSTGAYLPVRSSPTHAVVGAMVLWWAWFAFNAGSIQTVATGGQHVVAALAATNTALAAAAGGAVGIVISALESRGRFVDVFATINGCLSGLVGITAGCAFVAPWEAVIIGGFIAASSALLTPLVVRWRIDDPVRIAYIPLHAMRPNLTRYIVLQVGVIPVHLFSGIFGVLLTGLFAMDPANPIQASDSIGL